MHFDLQLQRFSINPRVHKEEQLLKGLKIYLVVGGMVDGSGALFDSV